MLRGHQKLSLEGRGGRAAAQCFGGGKVDKIGIIVGFGYMSQHEEPGATVERLAIGQVFADDVIGEMAGAAHDALLDVPGIWTDFQHPKVVIGFENEAVGIAEMKFYEFGEVAEVGDDGDFCAVGTKGVADGIRGVVRNGERRNFNVTDSETLAGADVLDAIEFSCGGFWENTADFDTSIFGEISGGAEMSNELREAAGVIGMFMGNENAVEAFGRFAESSEAAESFFASKAGIDKERGALGFQQRGVAGTARSQDGDSKADKPSRAARLHAVIYATCDA